MIEMIKNKKLLIIGITIIVCVLGVIGGLTYAFFSAGVEGNEDAKETVITTANLKIRLTDTNVMDFDNAYPGRTESKTFTVENTGNETANYDIYIENVVTNFIGSDLVYTITSNNDGGNKEETSLPSTDEKILDNISIDAGVTQTYTLTITFKETGLDQNNNQGASYSGLIQIHPRISNGTIVGYVRDQNGNAVANAMMSLHSTPRTTTTDESGYYEFRNVEAGIHTISVFDERDEVVASKEITMLVGEETLKKDDEVLVISTIPKKYVNIQVEANQGLNINVENASLILSEAIGTLYVGGNPKDIVVSGEGYGVLSCTSSDASVTCSITNNILTITPVSTGSGIVTLKEDKTNTEVTYTYEVKSTSLLISKTSGLLYVDGNDDEIDVTGTNLGEVTCGTTNNNVAVCSVSNGKLNVHPEGAGSAVITVREGNGNLTKTYDVEVRGVTLNLDSTSGTGYVGGANITSNITAVEVGNLTCESSDETKATCSINNNILYITPVAEGNVVITVREDNANKSVTYTATITEVTLSLDSTSGTGYVGESNLTSVITNINGGALSCESSDTSKATCSISNNTLTIVPISDGTVTVTLSENHANKSVTYTGIIKDVILSLSSTNGTGYVGGSNLTSTITNTNGGNLTCESSDISKATCSITDNILTIIPVGVGNAIVTVSEDNANKSVAYTAVIKEVSIILSSTSGTLYVGGTNKMITINGSNYANLGCESSDTSKATCIIAGTTLIITPVGAGNATITVNESNINKTAYYEATINAVEFNLSSTSGNLYVSGTKTLTISGEGYGVLSCESSDTTKATCEVQNSEVIINALATGTAVITVSEGNANLERTFTATISEALTVKARMLADNNEASDSWIDFHTAASASNGIGLYYNSSTTYGENNTVIYYYRGKVSNNWVSFAGNYWRIVRTTSEGGVKLLYAGNGNAGASNLTTGAFNKNVKSKYYMGYTYNASLNQWGGTQTNSNVKTVIDAWFEGKATTGGECNNNNCTFNTITDPLINYSNYFSPTAIFCNDRSSETVSNGQISYPGYNLTKNDLHPSFNCPTANYSKYTVSTSTGNGFLKYPAALLTLEEALFAGCPSRTETYITETSSNVWWIMTPWIYFPPGDSEGAWMFSKMNAAITAMPVDTTVWQIQPVVALKACVKVNGGTGVKADPYTLTDSGC